MSHEHRADRPLNPSDHRADDREVAAISALRTSLRTAAFVPAARFAGRVDRAGTERRRPGVARTIALRGGIAVVTTAMATLYFWLAYHIVFSMRIGPIIGSIDEGAGIGVHSGDILAVPLALLGFVTALAGIVAVTGRRLPTGRTAQLRAYRPAPVQLASLS